MLDLTIRNNINGDFKIVKEITEITDGAIINIKWNKRKLMLPYFPSKDFVSFADKKWNWSYERNNDGSIGIKDPILYELQTSGEIKEHKCNINNT